MNKTLVFVLGLLTGAAAGSLATYVLVRDKVQQEAADEIEEYAEHCEQRIALLKKCIEEAEELEKGPKEEEEEETQIDEEVKNNEGVKKYHHYNGPMSSSGERVFKDEKKEKEVTREEVAKKFEHDDAILGVSEATEEDFLKDDEYRKETIDYFFDGDKEEAYWAYNTDNQTVVEAKFGKPLKDLIGHAHAWLVDLTDETGVGAAYFKNDNLMTVFEVIVHDSTGFNSRG